MSKLCSFSFIASKSLKLSFSFYCVINYAKIDLFHFQCASELLQRLSITLNLQGKNSLHKTGVLEDVNHLICMHEWPFKNSTNIFICVNFKHVVSELALHAETTKMTISKSGPLQSFTFSEKFWIQSAWSRRQLMSTKTFVLSRLSCAEGCMWLITAVSHSMRKANHYLTPRHTAEI